MGQGNPGEPPDHGSPNARPPLRTSTGILILILIAAALLASGVGLFAAVGFLGNRMNRERRTSEAKNMVGAIKRGLIAAWQREGPNGHRLCGSAEKPVPPMLVRGVQYAPDPSPGRDFNTGDEDSGWRCLKFSTDLIRYQYAYRVGGNYKGPSRGGPDPGKDGFEISAEGDLDGNGKTSLFTLVGRVEGGELKLDKELFVVDELE